jgi:hypothetical protein
VGCFILEASIPKQAGGSIMDRIALALIASGLVLILAIVGVVLGGTAQDSAVYAAIGAALSGCSIVTGLALLERRAFSPRTA